MRLLPSVLAFGIFSLGLAPSAEGQPDGGVVVESDGGCDVPFSQDAGVMPVVSATAIDGTDLPPGWWLADSKMQALGVHLVQLTNERDQLKLQSESRTIAYVRVALTGLAIGCVIGGGTALYLDRSGGAPR